MTKPGRARYPKRRNQPSSGASTKSRVKTHFTPSSSHPGVVGTAFRGNCEDCARCVAGALVQAEGSEILDVTGGAAVTQAELAAMLSEVVGKQIVHVEVPPQGLTEGLTHAGLPPHMVKVIVDFDVEAAQGYHALLRLRSNG